MKKTLFLLALGILLIPPIVLADGGALINYKAKVYLPSQKAVVAWENGTETLILSTQIKTEDLANIAWIVPVPSKTKPEIEEGNIDIFYDLARLFSPTKRTPGLGILTGKREVEVIEVLEVDIYDIAILKATKAEALVSWLNSNGYLIPESTIPILQEYCEQNDFYFIANKIDLANKYKDLIITEGDRICAEGVSSSLPEYMKPSATDIRAVMEDLTSCEGTNFEAVKVLVELEKGIATPLKMTFAPKAPFYPLKLSSINDGKTVIDVYLFSEKPARDSGGLLTLSGMTKNTSAFKETYDLNQSYVTYTSFSGDLSDLNVDAWFEFREYDSASDPNYVSLSERIFELLYFILALAIYVVVPLTILVVATLGFVVVVKAVVRRIRKKRAAR